jgi:hypothetical protein
MMTHYKIRFWRFFLLIICLAFFTLSFRPAVSQSKQDIGNIQKVIRLQIEAMRKDDWEEAFKYASLDIRRSFGNAKTFQNMVLAKYRIVYQPRLISFKQVKLIKGTPVQEVYMIDSKGKSAMAMYFMRKDKNRDWRINGVQLFLSKKLKV